MWFSFCNIDKKPQKQFTLTTILIYYSEPSQLISFLFCLNLKKGKNFVVCVAFMVVF